MSRMEIVGKIKEALEDILDFPDLEITEDTQMEMLENWDSVTQMTMIATLEGEFGIQFDLNQIVGLKSVKELVDQITELV